MSSCTVSEFSHIVHPTQLYKHSIHHYFKPTQPAPHIAQASRISRTLRTSPSRNGFLHLGSDGVHRSFNSAMQVIDYKPLSPSEISAVLKAWTGGMSVEEISQLEEKWKGVDGRDVKEEQQLLHPGPGVMTDRPSSG